MFGLERFEPRKCNDEHKCRFAHAFCDLSILHNHKCVCVCVYI